MVILNLKSIKYSYLPGIGALDGLSVPSWPCCFLSTVFLYSSSSFSVRLPKGLGGRERVYSSSSLMKAWWGGGKRCDVWAARRVMICNGDSCWWTHTFTVSVLPNWWAGYSRMLLSVISIFALSPPITTKTLVEESWQLVSINQISGSCQFNSLMNPEWRTDGLPSFYLQMYFIK